MSQPQEWTPENISELTGQAIKGIVTYSSFEDFVKKVCDAHNAALAAEQEKRAKLSKLLEGAQIDFSLHAQIRELLKP